MDIVIPTYRRTDRQLTLSKIPDSWRKRTYLVCDGEDARFFNRRGVSVNFTVVPPKITTIAQKRAWIIKHWEGKKILMLDDDLKFVRRSYERTPTLIRQTESKDVEVCLKWVQMKLEKFSHVGISVRQGNNNLEKTQRARFAKLYDEAAEDIRWHIRWEPNYRMMYALGYDTDAVIEHCKLGRIEHREDMDYCMQMLRAGLENRVLTEFAMDAGTGYGTIAGGTSGQRKIEASNADAEKLARLHPGLVKVVEKTYKSVESRKEVICYWKKAIEEGRNG